MTDPLLDHGINAPPVPESERRVATFAGYHQTGPGAYDGIMPEPSPPGAPPRVPTPREKHAAELANLAGAYDLEWPPALNAGGVISTADLQAMQAKLECHPGTTYALKDRGRFVELLKLSGYI